MRVYLSLTLLLFSFFSKSQTDDETLYSKLIEINSEWLVADASLKELNQIVSFEEDSERIQKHLELVEKNFRSKKTSHLSLQQLNGRLKCLDILNSYGKAKKFPKNIYHPERTPYFIDHQQTHCAVGHLMMKSGYGKTARKIFNENNYGFIKELIFVYPEIEEWAKEFGFTIDELAWIQPTYAPCSTDCSISLEIVCANDDISEGFTFLWSNGETGQQITNACPGETYSCVVTDQFGIEISGDQCALFSGEIGEYYGTNTIDIPETIGAIFELTSDNSYSNYYPDLSFLPCTGTTTLQILNDVHITSTWNSSDIENSEVHLTDLCPGWNEIVFYTYYGFCMNVDSVFIGYDYSACPGDLNFDFDSNITDLNIFLEYFGCQQHCQADINKDGATTSTDLNLFLNSFGQFCLPFEFGSED